MRDGDLAFAARLYGRLERQPGNLFFSPASIRLALAMAYAGARGETAREMQRVLELPPGEAVHEAFAAELRSWEALARPDVSEPHGPFASRSDLELLLANRLWGDRAHSFLEPFLALLRDAYRAPLEQLDFTRDPEVARLAINRWVAEQTQRKIREILGPGVIRADTKLVLTNAVYFKACWQERFEPESTEEGSFFSPSGKVQVPLMHQVMKFQLGEFDGGQVLELPYGNGRRLMMEIVLPTARDGLASLARRIGEGELEKWLNSFESTLVDVTLPRFKVSCSFSLARTFRDLGMAKAFEYPGADFSGMDGTRDLFLADVLHRAIVEVDERGTEAAASTMISMGFGARLGPQPAWPVPFRADHPFLFLIRERASRVVLFIGRVEDPTAQ
jgi:serpin B